MFLSFEITPYQWTTLALMTLLGPVEGIKIAIYGAVETKVGRIVDGRPLS